VIRRITTLDEVRRVAAPVEAEPTGPQLYLARPPVEAERAAAVSYAAPPARIAVTSPAPIEAPRPRPVPAAVPPVLASAGTIEEAAADAAAPLRHRRGWAWG
jgi:hypothetical protein